MVSAFWPRYKSICSKKYFFSELFASTNKTTLHLFGLLLLYFQTGFILDLNSMTPLSKLISMPGIKVCIAVSLKLFMMYLNWWHVSPSSAKPGSGWKADLICLSLLNVMTSFAQALKLSNSTECLSAKSVQTDSSKYSYYPPSFLLSMLTFKIIPKMHHFFQSNICPLGTTETLCTSILMQSCIFIWVGSDQIKNSISIPLHLAEHCIAVWNDVAKWHFNVGPTQSNML